MKAKDGPLWTAALFVKAACLRGAAYPLRLRIMREAVMLTTASAKLSDEISACVKHYCGCTYYLASPLSVGGARAQTLWCEMSMNIIQEANNDVQKRESGADFRLV